MKKWHKQAIKLFEGGHSPSEIAKLINRNYHTVYMFLKRYQEGRGQAGEPKLKQYYEKLKKQNLIEPIKEFLLLTHDRKGKTLVTSLRKLYLGYQPHLEMNGIKMGKTRFYEFVKYIIIKEFGSIEAFENQRRGTPTKNRKSKGRVRRFSETIEIDATGITWNGKLYFILAVMDLKTGYMLPPYIVETKETKAKYYNTAINSLDVAKYLRDIFIEYGVPKAIKSDNEETLKAEIINRAFKKLGIKHLKTKPYNPQQKLIERTFRTIKDDLIMFAKEQNFEKALQKAIQYYNSSPHQFKEYKETIIPAEYFEGYSHVEEETIRKAFRERFQRIIRNNTISIEKDKYEIYVDTEKLGNYGRNIKNQVIIYRDIDNKTIIDVYHATTGEYLGTARLIHTETTLDSISSKQLKNKEKRMFKREAKLKNELSHIEKEKEKSQPTLETTEDLLKDIENIETDIEEEVELPDILELFE